MYYFSRMKSQHPSRIVRFVHNILLINIFFVTKIYKPLGSQSIGSLTHTAYVGATIILAATKICSHIIQILVSSLAFHFFVACRGGRPRPGRANLVFLAPAITHHPPRAAAAAAGPPNPSQRTRHHPNQTSHPYVWYLRSRLVFPPQLPAIVITHQRPPELSYRKKTQPLGVNCNHSGQWIDRNSKYPLFTIMQKFLQVALHLFVVATATAADFAAPFLGTTNMMSPLSSRVLTPIIVGVRSAMTPRVKSMRRTPTASFDITGVISRGGAVTAVADVKAPPKFLKWAYTAAGTATMAAWSTMVYTTIRSNQPPGALMPSPQHGFFARLVRYTF
jgi:hypothetical protein